MILPIAAGVLAVLTVAMLWFGLRGRVVTEHPVCRRCHFDLVGSVGVNLCPECGANLWAKRGVRQGLRGRRWWAVALALLGFVMFLGTTALMVSPWGKRIEWNQYKPGWLLVQEAEGAFATSEPVLKEIMARRASGEMGSSAYRSLVEHALRRQADGLLAWSKLWGDLIEDAESRGDLTPEQWRQYLTRVVQHTLDFRSSIHASSGLHFSLETDADRASSHPSIQLHFTGGDLTLKQDGQQPIVVPQAGGFGSEWDGDNVKVGTGIPLEGAKVPPGTYHATLRIPATITGRGASIQTDVIKSAELTVVPEDESTVRFLGNSDLIPAPEANALLSLGEKFPSLRFSSAQATTNTNFDRQLHLAVRIVPQSFDVAFKCKGLALNPDGTAREIALPNIAIRRGVDVCVTAVVVPAEFDVERMTVVLTADPRAAEGTLEINEIWKGEIRIENVVVEDGRGGIRMPPAPVKK